MHSQNEGAASSANEGTRQVLSGVDTGCCQDWRKMIILKHPAIFAAAEHIHRNDYTVGKNSKSSFKNVEYITGEQIPAHYRHVHRSDSNWYIRERLEALSRITGEPIYGTILYLEYHFIHGWVVPSHFYELAMADFAKSVAKGVLEGIIDYFPVLNTTIVHPWRLEADAKKGGWDIDPLRDHLKTEFDRYPHSKAFLWTSEADWCCQRLCKDPKFVTTYRRIDCRVDRGRFIHEAVYWWLGTQRGVDDKWLQQRRFPPTDVIKDLSLVWRKVCPWSVPWSDRYVRDPCTHKDCGEWEPRD
ncbi:hypothetical protein GGR57DRAFT_516884 [Xylariaceae sp. FL1272]|nr:hypothetical protein GGR57DRAFT_516884 [Xylariaceae sp. FL1272]